MKNTTEEVRKRARKEYLKQWYEANKEKIAERHKQYYKDNAEKIAEQHKQYYQDNKEKLSKQNKQYYQANKEKTLEQKKQYYTENKEKVAEHQKQYRKTPMGRALNLINTYKQKDKKCNRGECTLTAKWIVHNIFSSKCIYCGESDWTKLGCDRIDNEKPHTEDNVVCSCWNCNNKRKKKPFEEFLAESPQIK